MKKKGLRAKVRAHIAARERGKQEYERADKLLEEILASMKPGEEVPFDATGRKAKLVDNFENGNTAFRAHGIKHFEIKVV